MLELQEISDRMRIRDVLVDYAYKVDDGDFDGLRSVFTEDAWLDYTATGAIAAGLEEMIAYLKRVMPGMANCQHLMGNTRLRLDGDRADATTQCFNPLVLPAGEAEHVMFVGLWYVDVLLRVDNDSWRISERVQRRCYFHNVPEGFNAPAQ